MYEFLREISPSDQQLDSWTKKKIINYKESTNLVRTRVRWLIMREM